MRCFFNDMKENINLVNKKGERIGFIEKIEAHQKGLLHEAFSIFVFNEKNELLIQRRNPAKYHSGGLWSNTCCSHPSVNEDINLAIHRRLKEEMGFDCDLEKMFPLVYKIVNLNNNLLEYEYDYIFKGRIKGAISISLNPDEVSEYRWSNIPNILDEMKEKPELFTEWFKIIINNEKFLNIINNFNKLS